MTRSLRLLLIAPACVLAAIAPPVQSAEGQGWYAGLSYGRTDVQFGANFASPGNTTTGTLTKDQSVDSGFKAFAGYRFTQYTAVEGGFFDFGSFSATRNTTTPTVSSAKYTIKPTGVNLDAVGILPIGDKIELFGKGGFIYVTTKTEPTTSNISPPPSNSKRSEWDPKFGLGVEYRLTPVFGLRAEYERVLSVGSQNSTGQGNINMLSIGLTCRF